MIGGEKEVVRRLDPIFRNCLRGWAGCADAGAREAERDGGAGLSALRASGAGHFVKMVHNGIEYGMMAAYAEGLNILSPRQRGQAGDRAGCGDDSDAQSRVLSYDLNLPDIAEVWRREA